MPLKYAPRNNLVKSFLMKKNSCKNNAIMTRIQKKILLHDSTNMYWRIEKKSPKTEKKHEKPLKNWVPQKISPFFVPKRKFLLRLQSWKNSHLWKFYDKNNERDFKLHTKLLRWLLHKKSQITKFLFLKTTIFEKMRKCCKHFLFLFCF